MSSLAGKKPPSSRSCLTPLACSHSILSETPCLDASQLIIIFFILKHFFSHSFRLFPLNQYFFHILVSFPFFDVFSFLIAFNYLHPTSFIHTPQPHPRPLHLFTPFPPQPQDAQQLKLDLLYQREVKKKHKRRMQEGLVAVASLVVALPKLQGVS